MNKNANKHDAQSNYETRVLSLQQRSPIRAVETVSSAYAMVEFSS